MLDKDAFDNYWNDMTPQERIKEWEDYAGDCGWVFQVEFESNNYNTDDDLPWDWYLYFPRFDGKMRLS